MGAVDGVCSFYIMRFSSYLAHHALLFTPCFQVTDIDGSGALSADEALILSRTAAVYPTLTLAAALA